MIKASGVCKSFGKNAVLRDISFEAQSGSCVCVIGQNGCGKSTLLNILAGLIKPDGGTVENSAKSVGYCPQTDALFSDLTVKDNLRFFASAAGVTLGAFLETETAAVFSVKPILKKRVKHLSGGMLKRVSIAASLAGRPEAVILDEPFSGLDAAYRAALMEFLRELKNAGKTIIYTCHSPEAAFRLPDKILLIDGGAIAFAGGEDDYEKMFLKITGG